MLIFQCVVQMGLLIKNLYHTKEWYDTMFIIINCLVIAYWMKQYIRARKFATKNFLDDKGSIPIPQWLLKHMYDDIEKSD